MNGHKKSAGSVVYYLLLRHRQTPIEPIKTTARALYGIVLLTNQKGTYARRAQAFIVHYSGSIKILPIFSNRNNFRKCYTSNIWVPNGEERYPLGIRCKGKDDLWICKKKHGIFSRTMFSLDETVCFRGRNIGFTVPQHPWKGGWTSTENFLNIYGCMDVEGNFKRISKIYSTFTNHFK